MPRPFIKLNYKKLEEAVEGNSRSRKQLELLIAEIKTRKKTQELLAPTLKKAQKFLEKEKNKNQKNNSYDNSKSELPNDTKLEDSINFEYDDHQNEEKFENIELTNSPKELGFIREPSNSLKGLPNVYSYEPKEYPVNGLNEASTRTEKYIRTLEGLILEIRRGHKFSKTIALTNGKKEPENSGEYGYLYSFKFDSDEEFLKEPE